MTFSATGKSPGVEGRSALPMGVVGAQPPLGEERGAKSDDLLLEGRSPSSHRWVQGLPSRINSRAAEHGRAMLLQNTPTI